MRREMFFCCLRCLQQSSWEGGGGDSHPLGPNQDSSSRRELLYSCRCSVSRECGAHFFKFSGMTEFASMPCFLSARRGGMPSLTFDVAELNLIFLSSTSCHHCQESERGKI